MRKIILILMLGVFLINFMSASISFVTDDLQHHVYVNGEGSEGSPIGFEEIIDYFDANPIPSNLQMPLSGDLSEDNSIAWNTSFGDVGVIDDEVSITQVGSYSINATKNGTADVTLVWSAEDDTNFSHFFSAGVAETVIFWIRVDNSSIELDKVISRKYYSAANQETYPTEFRNKDNDDNGWSFSVDTWTKVEITIRDDYYSRADREWWDRISRFQFVFSGGESGDIIYIDGLRTELANPNPINDYGTHYFFPTSLWIWNSYFADDDFSFVSNVLSGGGWSGSVTDYSISAANNYQFDLGSYTGGGFADNNQFSPGLKGYYLVLQPNHNPANIIGITSLGGISVINSYADSEVLVENCNFYNAVYLDALLYYEDTLILRNIMVGDIRLNLRGNYMPVVDGYTYYGGYLYAMWLSSGEVKGMKPVMDSGKILQIRGIRNQNETFNLTNPDFSEAGDDTYASFQSYSFPTSYQRPGRLNLWNVLFTLDMKVTDEDGDPLEDVTIKLTDVNGSTAFETTTSANGSITEQSIITRYISILSDGTIQTILWDPKGISTVYTNHGTSLNPFTLTITKNNYETYSATFNLTEKEDWTIALESRDWNYSNTLAWKILNLTDTTILKLDENGNLAIAGKLYENTNTAPDNVIYKIANVLWLTQKGDLYLVKELMEVIL